MFAAKSIRRSLNRATGSHKTVRGDVSEINGEKSSYYINVIQTLMAGIPGKDTLPRKRYQFRLTSLGIQHREVRTAAFHLNRRWLS